MPRDIHILSHTPKKPPKAPEPAQIANNPRPRGGHILGYVGHLDHPQPPTFCGLHPSNGHLPPPPPTPVLTRLQQAASLGPSRWVPKWVLRAQPRGGGVVKKTFSKMIPDHARCQNKSARFEPVLACFGPPKNPKCLENGPFGVQKWVKNGLKTRFSKLILEFLGCTNK